MFFQIHNEGILQIQLIISPVKVIPGKIYKIDES